MSRIERIRTLQKKFKLDWVAINYRNDYGRKSIIIAPYCDGNDSREEILRKHIPFLFILIVKLLFPLTSLFIRGLVTREQIEAEMKNFQLAWDGSDY